MIEKMNLHYSFENPASAYDEEALTALELAGRQGAKINELVEAQNKLHQDTEKRMESQDETIAQRMNTQDESIENIRTQTIPNEVASELQRLVNNGTFEAEISEHIGNLEERVDNLLANVPAGGTSMDAEVVDARTRANGLSYDNAGSASRAIDSDLQQLKTDTHGTILYHELMQDFVGWSSGVEIETLQGATYEITEDNRLIWTMNGSQAIGNPGIACKAFNVGNKNHLIYLSIDFECNRDSVLQIYLAGQYGFNGSNQVTYVSPLVAGKHLIKINPSDFAFDIHTIWLIQNGGVATENTYIYTINDFRVFQNPLMDAGLKGETTQEFLLNLHQMHIADSTRTDEQMGYSVLAGVNNMPEYTKVWTNVKLEDEELINNGATIKWDDLSDGGVVTPELTVDPNRQLRISFDLDFNTNDADYFFTVLLGETYDFSGAFNEIQVIRESGHYDLVVDPAYYSVYHNLDIKRVWFLSHVYYEEGVYHNTTLSNVKIYQSLLADNGYTDNLAKAIVEVGSGKVTPTTDTSYMIAPDGSRYVVQIDDGGAFYAVPVNPGKALFIGNSLLNGFNTFGMAASDSGHDYYHLVNQAFKSKKAGYTPSKIHGYGWESQESIEGQNTWLNDELLPLLDSDLDLVVVQLGDNVNTAERLAVFEEGVKNMLLFIRANCPKARVVWMGAWYQNKEKMAQMLNGCNATGCLFVNIWDLNITANQSAIGNTYTADDGTVHTIESEGVASHPGNNGMKAIANRLLYSLGFTDNERYYE